MAFDAGYLSAICDEIREELSDSRLERIFQCTRDTFVLEFRAAKKPRPLFVSAGPSGGGCYLTERKIAHPDTPPMFCMLLRKHLTGGRFLDVSQLGFERVLRLDIEFVDAFGYPLLRSLYLEAMGKNSNLVLCDENGVILGALRTLDLAQSPDRPLLCGMKYTPPAPRENTVSLMESDVTVHLKAALKAADPAEFAADFLLKQVSGIGPVAAREIVYRACKDSGVRLSALEKETLVSEVECLQTELIQRRFSFCAVYDTLKSPSRALEYSYRPLLQYEGFETRLFDTPSKLMDAVSGEREEQERLRQRTDRAHAILRAARKRLRRKLDAQLSDLSEAEGCEEARRAGDLIMQEIWRIRRGDALVQAQDYESGETVAVKLDTRLTPSQNAQVYYKRYQKQKRTLAALKTQIEETRGELVYADSIAESLSSVETLGDAEEICREVSAWDYGRRFSKQTEKSGKPRKKESLPLVSALESPSGFSVLCGKNNLQNDRITFTLGAKNDLWFHVKGRPGPHVILHVEGDREVRKEDLLFAAECALPRAVEKVGCEIDYTLVKLVKRHPSRLPGHVVYTGEKTIFARKSD